MGNAVSYYYLEGSFDKPKKNGEKVVEKKHPAPKKHSTPKKSKSKKKKNKTKN